MPFYIGKLIHSIYLQCRKGCRFLNAKEKKYFSIWMKIMFQICRYFWKRVILKLNNSLICTIISENQGILQNLKRVQVLHSLICFQFSILEKSWVYAINLKKKSRCQTWKNGSAGPESFLNFEIDLDFSRT